MKNSFNINFTQLLDEADIMALKAISTGNANERQQIIGMKAIFHKLCRTGSASYSEDSSRQTDFNEGVRYVGVQIHSAVLCDINALKKKTQPKKPTSTNN